MAVAVESIIEPIIASEPITQRVTLARAEVLAALRVLAPICKQKASYTLPVLSCVHIANGRISATDLKIGVSFAVTTWPPVSDAAMCLDASALLKVCQSSKADSLTITFTPGNSETVRHDGAETVHNQPARATVQCGMASIGVAAFDADEFPLIPDTAEFAHFATVPGAALATILNRALPFASTDTTRGPLQHINLTATPGYLTAAATDAYRLAVVSVPATNDVAAINPLFEKPRNAVMPTINMPEPGVARWLKAITPKCTDDATITVKPDGGQYAVTCGAVTVLGTLTSEPYVNYRQILPKSPRVMLLCNAAELLTAINMVFTRDGSSMVALCGVDAGIQVSGEVDGRESLVVVPGVMRGGGIGFNRDYLAAILAPLGKLDVQMLQTGDKDGNVQPTHAGMWRADSDTAFGMAGTYLVMPVTVPR